MINTKLHKKASLLLGSFYFFYFGLLAVYIIFLPKLLIGHGYSASELGMIYSTVPFMRFILPFIFRKYIYLSHKIYHISLLILVLSSAIFHIAVDEFWFLFLSNICFGIGLGVAPAFIESIAVSTIPKERYGRVRLWGSIGFIFMTLWLGKYLYSLEQALVYLSILALISAFIGYFIASIENEIDNHKKTKHENKSFSLSKYWLFWLGTFLVQVSFGGLYGFFTIYETSHGVSLQVTSYLWTFGVLCEIIIFYFQGPILKYNLLSIIKFTTASAVIRWSMLYLYPDSLIITFMSQSLHAFSFALYYTAIIRYVHDLYTQKKLAQQFLLGITFGLGGGVGALLAGLIYDINSELLFGIESIIAFMALIILFSHQKRKEHINAYN